MPIVRKVVGAHLPIARRRHLPRLGRRTTDDVEAQRVPEVEWKLRDEADRFDAGNLARHASGTGGRTRPARRSNIAQRGSTTFVVTTCSTRNPGSTASNRRRLRPNSIAPDIRIDRERDLTDDESVAQTTRAADRPASAAPAARRAARASSIRNAGMMPKPTPATSETTRA